MQPKSAHGLLVECPDQRGLVHGITGTLLRQECNVIANQEFVDNEARRFFMRTEFTGEINRDLLLCEANEVLPQGAVARLATHGKRRVVVLVSREHHCLAELLVRHRFGDYDASPMLPGSPRTILAGQAA